MIQNLGYRGLLNDNAALAAQLAATGLSPTACQSKAALFAKVAAALLADGQASATAHPVAFFVPGRIEVLGKHTDYAGGCSLVTAAERGFCLVAVPREDSQVRVIDAQLGESAQFEIDPQLTTTVGHWSNYPRTTVRRLARNFPDARRGATLALASDLPPAAGMSSSSAFMVSIFLALEAVNNLPASALYRDNIHELTDLAGYLGTVENGQTFGTLVGDRGVGTFGGSEDHTAMLCGRPGMVSQYAYRPVRFERALSVPAGYCFAVGSSGVVAEKTGAARDKYNRVSQLIVTIEELWADKTGGSRQPLAAVLAGSPAAAEQVSELLKTAATEKFDSAALLTRFQHFLGENQRIIPAASDALARGDIEAFGRAVDQSQQGAEELLGNQVPETCHLAAAARKLGAAAASAFGAGFGGSVWALVHTAQADAFLAAWSESYRQRFPQHAAASAFFATAAGPGAFRVC